MHQPLSAWARVDVELPFLAEMAMSGPLRPDIAGMPISYANGVVPFGLVLGSPILVGMSQDAKMTYMVPRCFTKNESQRPWSTFWNVTRSRIRPMPDFKDKEDPS